MIYKQTFVQGKYFEKELRGSYVGISEISDSYV
jgi:hypothetical protein